MLAFWILWRAIALRVPQIGWFSRIVWLSLGLALAGPVMGVRVQVLDLLFATAVVWLLWRYLVDVRRRWLVGLPLITLLWANVHAGWVLVFLLGGAVLVGEGVDRLLKRRLEGTPPLTWRANGELGVALLASLAVLVLNPNGLALYAYPLYTLSITALSRYVMEWFPASLDTLFGQLLAGFAIVAVLPTLIFGRRRLRTADALILVGPDGDGLPGHPLPADRWTDWCRRRGRGAVAGHLGHGLWPTHVPDPGSAVPAADRQAGHRQRGPDRPAGAGGRGRVAGARQPGNPGGGDRARPARRGGGLDG